MCVDAFWPYARFFRSSKWAGEGHGPSGLMVNTHMDATHSHLPYTDITLSITPDGSITYATPSGDC